MARSLLGRSTLPLALPAVLLLGVAFLVPLIMVLSISVLEPVPGLGNYEALLDQRAVRTVFGTTFRIAATVTVIATLCAYVIAFAMVHASGRVQSAILAAVMVPLWSSVLIRAFAWVTLLRGNGVVNTVLEEMGLIDLPLAMMRNDFGVVVGMAHVMIPLATLPIFAVMRGIDTRLVPAARSLGASEARAILAVFLPLSLPGLAAAAVLVFVNSLGFFITPAVLGGGKTVMVAEYIEVQISTTLRWGLATMMATTLLAAVFGLFALGARLPAFRQQFRL